MQVLKDEIRNKILSVSEDLFYEKGFSGTSMRSIADVVGISASNLYLYYENKEAVFAGVIDAFYKCYINGFHTFIDHKENDDLQLNIARVLRQIIANDPKKFVILMDKSGSTKYEGVKDQIIENIQLHVKSQLRNDSDYNELVISIIIHNFFVGIVEIAKQYKDEVLLEKSFHTFVMYHMTGIAQFI
jgi:AcrR family transcriptional regulator